MIAARPLTRSFTCFVVKPVFSASSACVQPFSSSRSSMVSPGGEIQSGVNDSFSIMAVPR